MRLVAVAVLALAACVPQSDREPVTDAIPIVTLHDAVEFPDGFSGIRGVAELPVPDRVLVVDWRERTLDVADFAAGVRKPAATAGGGPLEYRYPGGLLRGAAAYHDLGQRRLLFFSDAGEPLRTVRYRPETPAEPGEAMLPVVMDTLGNVYGTTREYLSPVPRTMAMQARADSTVVWRWNIASGAREALFRLRPSGQGGRPTIASAGGALRIVVHVEDFAAPDEWTVLPDGRIAVLRGGEYRVHFIEQDGSERIGPLVPHVAVPVTAEDIEVARGRARVVASAQYGPGATVEIREPARYAAERPPYAYVIASPDGLLWVATYASPADSLRTYDVLDGSGALVARVRLPEGERLEGSGRGRVYTSWTDAEGFARLRRYEFAPGG